MSDIDTSKIRRLDGALLLVMRELLRCRNATEAARRLSLSQSAISHSLRRLRDLFQDPLFVRRSHGLEPTRRAQALAPKIDALLELASETLDVEESYDPTTTPRSFNLAAPEFVTALIGAPLLRLLSPYAPLVPFACRHLSPEATADGLRRGEIDVALGRFETLAIGGLVRQPAFEDQYCIVARRNHPRLRDAISEPEYLAMAHVWASSGSEAHPDDAYSDYSIFRTAAVVPHWLTALSLVSVTDALATCPRRFAESQADVLNLQVLDTPWESPPFTVSALRRAEGRDPGVDWFMARVLEAIG
jgi:DNA-binding transcriptional LysR family regulator